MAKKKYTKKEILELNILNSAYWSVESAADKLGVGVDTLLFNLMSGNARKMTEEYFKSLK